MKRNKMTLKHNTQRKALHELIHKTQRYNYKKCR